MTLEQIRSLPWHEHDSIMEQILEPEPTEPAEHDGSLASLGEQGFKVRRVG